ncbi:MAG: molybdopterin oxidoreductase, partial [Dehalococcoidia bacterium]
DPSDRPYRGWKKGDPAYEVARLICRARYYPGTPRGVTRMWFNMYGATPGSVKGIKARADRLAKNPDTGYQAMFRHGSHQSGVRAWLRPTLLTDGLVRKPFFGQELGVGFESDVHCANGAPKESFIKMEKAEDGAPEGGLWKPARNGVRAGYESDLMKQYLSGGFYQA